MSAYYNEFDPFAAAWLRELIKAGHIADGVVDERSIVDVKPEDLEGFTQCHFFAGIGGWSRALRLANWPDSRPVWTGSPPCQPFSVAGLQLGEDDPRHLAPTWLKLVKARKPVAVFGEQVAAAVKKDEWLDNVLDELEAENYAAGAIVLPACSVGAPQLRQRIWLVGERVADTISQRQSGECGGSSTQKQRAPELCEISELADAGSERLQGRKRESGARKERESGGHDTQCGSTGGLADSEGERRSEPPNGEGQNRQPPELREDSRPRTLNGSWRNVDWILCRDGKWRPVEPGSFPLAHGLHNRVGTLRGYGNAIVPEVAAEVIAASMEIFDEVNYEN